MLVEIYKFAIPAFMLRFSGHGLLINLMIAASVGSNAPDRITTEQKNSVESLRLQIMPARAATMEAAIKKRNNLFHGVGDVNFPSFPMLSGGES